MSAIGGVPHLPGEFSAALEGLRSARRRSEVRLDEVPAPARLAPFAVALGAEVFDTTPAPPPLHGPARSLLPPPEVQELATGRFILLHDPAGSAVWNGRFRIVTYIRAQLEPAMGNDAMLGSVAWTWLVEALENNAARHHSTGGTTTRILSESHGTLEDRTDTIDIELRASWSPQTSDVRPHLEAWTEMVCMFAGLPPLPRVVAHLSQRRP